MKPVIRFQGREYLLVGNLVEGGPIATKEQYENGECSYAHLLVDGTVVRYGDSIGHRDEIEVIGEYEAAIKASLVEMLTHPSWGERK